MAPSASQVNLTIAAAICIMLLQLHSANQPLSAVSLPPAARRLRSCDGRSGMMVRQRDLQFNHPATTVTITFRCPGCFATNVRLRCKSAAWRAVAPEQLQVLGGGVCLLQPGQVISPMSSVNFLYLHSPPLDLEPISFDCA